MIDINACTQTAYGYRCAYVYAHVLAQQPETDLYCVAAKYTPLTNTTLDVFNYGNRGRVRVHTFKLIT